MPDWADVLAADLLGPPHETTAADVACVAAALRAERAAEREACAKIAEETRWHSSGPTTCDAVARAIRARS